jgi:hypothetical protein
MLAYNSVLMCSYYALIHLSGYINISMKVVFSAYELRCFEEAFNFKIRFIFFFNLIADLNGSYFEISGWNNVAAAITNHPTCMDINIKSGNSPFEHQRVRLRQQRAGNTKMVR